MYFNWLWCHKHYLLSWFSCKHKIFPGLQLRQWVIRCLQAIAVPRLSFLEFFNTNFQVTAKASVLLHFASSHWILPCVFLLKCEISNGVGFVMASDLFPTIQGVRIKASTDAPLRRIYAPISFLLAWISTRDNLLFFTLRSRGLGLTLLNYLKPSIGYNVSNLISLSTGYVSKLEIRKQNIATGGCLAMMNSHSIKFQMLTSYCSEGSRWHHIWNNTYPEYYYNQWNVMLIRNHWHW